MKMLLNEIKSEKKKRNKNFDKIENLEKELVKFKYANNPNKLQSEFKKLKKIHVVDKNVHGFKQEVLRDYADEFEMVGNLEIGDQTRQTHIRLRKIFDYEAYIISIDERYDAQDAIFNGFILKIDLIFPNLT